MRYYTILFLSMFVFINPIKLDKLNRVDGSSKHYGACNTPRTSKRSR